MVSDGMRRGQREAPGQGWLSRGWGSNWSQEPERKGQCGRGETWWGDVQWTVPNCVGCECTIRDSA